jgi:hypothetical protein
MILALIVVVLGIILLIGGIITGKHGATVGGIIVSGAAAQSYISLRKRSDHSEKR